MAETILDVLRGDEGFTRDEAMLLDVMLMLHAEHGGGNNSSFTCRVLSSSGTDAYSAYVGALGSLKGPKHGGANIKAKQMMDNINTFRNFEPLSDEEKATVEEVRLKMMEMPNVIPIVGNHAKRKLRPL